MMVAPSLRDAMRKESWYHTIDLPDGSCTAGTFDTRESARRLQWPTGLEGGRCLDIGTCDGFWAFEMERRGAAEVVAVDVGHANDVDLAWAARARDTATPRKPGPTHAGRRFGMALEALGSRVTRVECSVYDLDPAVHGTFDVVFCGTLLIHLRDPVRALERVRAVCTGELILVECVDASLDLFSRRVPAARLEPAPGQWWRNNTAGLVRTLRLAGFDVESVSKPFLTPFGAAILQWRRGWWRPLIAVSALIAKWPALSRLPGLVHVVGLIGASYDVAIRARPSAARQVLGMGD